MLIFQSSVHLLKWKSRFEWKNNICCRKTTLLLKTSNNDVISHRMSFFSFVSKSHMNLLKTRAKKLSRAYARFSEGYDAINDVQCDITSLLLVFNKTVVFQQQMLLFHSNLDFYLNVCTETWKTNTCCRKTTLLLNTSNNDVASGAGLPPGNYRKWPLPETLTFSENC